MSTPSNLICECNDDSRSACGGDQISTSEDGESRHYCVLHFRSANKGQAFEEALQNKIRRNDFNFNGVWFPRDVDFGARHFGGRADFRGATFDGELSCYQATFTDEALWNNATFNGKADFGNIKFQGKVSFKTTQFNAEADFVRTKFRNEADFASARFRGSVNFLSAAFGGTSDFSEAVFDKKVKFAGLTFKGEANFRKTVFEGEADFSGAVFNGANFKSAVFGSKADFQGAALRTCSSKYYVQKADFSRVEFRGEADFAEVKFMRRVLTDEEEAAARHRAFMSSHTYLGLSEKERTGTADFGRTRFYEEADFAASTFEIAADFHRAIFSGYADFSPRNTDNDVKLRTVLKAGADFKEAAFNAEANFSEVDFQASKVTFARATFKDYVRFSGEDRKKLLAGSFDLRHAMVDKPERMSFHSVGMHPCWLVDVDVRKFDFTNVKWHGTGFREMITYLCNMGVNEPYRLLEKLCLQLGINHEENQRYRWASKWRFSAMEARRQERFYGYPVWSLNWWYWLASGYGEKSVRAVIWLGLIWASFAIFYMNVGFVQPSPNQPAPNDTAVSTRDTAGKPLEPARAFTYSLGVITLQKPEPRPLTVWAQTLITVETIIGPLQAALLALAVRRRFMR